MLYWLFLTTSVAGGTILVCQFLLTLMGAASLGGDADLGADLGADGAGVDLLDGHEVHADANWLFAMFSFRTVTAGAAFFGLGGLGAASLGYPPIVQLVAAILCGFAAIYGVFYLLNALMKLNADNTVRIHRAIGQRGTVYVTIPAQSKGQGKVQVAVQSRLMEYPAVTRWEVPLRTGEPVTVVALHNHSTLEVAPMVGEK